MENNPPKRLYRSTKNEMLGGVCGGVAVEAQEEVVEDEEQASADLDDTQAGGLLALEGDHDEGHGAKAPDLAQDEERCHTDLLVGRIVSHYSTDLGICKGKNTKIFAVALTDGGKCDTIGVRSGFDRFFPA